ncbi:MAG: Crp/Fnr family transcriptional regulator [Paludibacteraceae bacterium]|jgi:CRP-like cAMP-binding protein|nr:Crp/Fnr family transcriptional regulator [Paludibacteraceae bacterium]MBP6437230.1 Crp/Fnr family transcriptional regulator [Paludibacteraceae bacterium]MBP7219925.1 Crp/Fnr family transcriptional regulator [Paludibacteraceae bacterium]MBP8627186.1 Crp/Fnr family transcriptional regulator [Paludibacteraceae bacterium]MBP9648816.1 Crp/Fnr family transcriptional regulator [Paludibacteraceae bacterium]
MIWNNIDDLVNGKDDVFSDVTFSCTQYPKNELVFRQNDICDSLYLLSKGSVKTEMITENGNLLGIEIIHAPRPLAPAFLFSEDNRFPVDVTSITDIEIIKIPKKEVVRLMSLQPDFMHQFISHNSNRTQFLTHRLQLLTIKTIKGKIAYFLLEQMQEYGNPFMLERNQTELADFFNIPRPSLARSLSELVQENAIRIERKKITILDENKLKELLV